MKQQKPFWGSLKSALFKKIQLDQAAPANKFLGKKVMAHKGDRNGLEEEITINAVQGVIGAGREKENSLEKYLLINGTHWVHAFSYFTQLIDGRLPTEEELEEFELASDVKKIRTLDGQAKKKSK